MHADSTHSMKETFIQNGDMSLRARQLRNK